MPHNQPLTLQVANRGEFAVAVRILGLLALLAAVLSPQPILMSAGVVSLFGAGWRIYISGVHKIDGQKLNLLVFSDGQMRLESNSKDAVGGNIEGQQWCTHWFAVLRVRVEGTTRNLLILSTQQQYGDFRRLNMWLRQNFCSGTTTDKVLDV